MKLKNNITKFGIIALASLTLTVGVAAAAASSIKSIEAGAYYTPSTHHEVSDTASELASYYSSIKDTDTGTSLLNKLRTLNNSKRTSAISYSGQGTDTSGAFIYTDYDLNSTRTDSNGQIYGTKVASFYTKTAATGWNREHVWPKSHGGNLVEGDILHTRPTISSENSDRGNSFYVEGKCSQSAGWDPAEAGYSEGVRGECARIILYSVVASSSLDLIAADSHSTSNDNRDNLMGNMHTLIKWHYQYSPNIYELNRNNGAEYLQGNRNPFVDHPEYVARIWSSFDSTVSTLVEQNESMYDNWVPGSASSYGSNDGVDASLSISNSTKSLTVDGTATISATSSNNSTITWITSDSSVVSISSGSAASGANITLTANAAGTATITAKAIIDGNQHTKTCTVTVSSSGSSSGDEGGDVGADGLVTNISQLSDGDKVVLATATNGKGVTGWNDSKDATVSTNSSQWKQYTVDVNGSSFTLKDDAAGKYIASPGGNEFKYNTSAGSCTVDSNGRLVCNSRNLFENGSYYRFYGTSSTYTPFLVYKVGTSVTLSSLTKTGTLTKTSYYDGDEFDSTGLTFTANFSDSTTSNVTESVTFTPSPLTTGTTSVTATYEYGGVSKTVTVPGITVVAKTLQSLQVSGTPNKKTYDAGETFVPTGVTVTATFNSGSEDVTSSVTWAPSPLTAGTTSVTGSYTYGNTTKSVTVNGLTVNAVAQTYTVTIDSSNCNLPSDALTSASTKVYAIESTGTTLGVTWGVGSFNKTSYNEISFTKESETLLIPTNTAKVKKITIDNWKFNNNLSVTATDTTVTSVEGTSTSNDESKVMVYTFTNATSNWSISHSTVGTYTANVFSFTFEITQLPPVIHASGVTLAPQATSIAVGGTTTLVATVSPADASNQNVTWSSNKTSVATVSDSGVVTGVAAGSATITVATVDGGYTASCLITVSAQSGDTWELASSISAGDTIVFAYSTGSVTAGNISNKIMTSVSSTFSSDKSKITSLGSGTVEFTVGTSGSNYTFTNSSTNKLLGVTSEKNLAWASGTTTWTVSISSGTAAVGSTNTNYGKLYYNTGSPRFTTYKNAQASIQIYKKTSSATATDTADTFSTIFLNVLTCDVNGTAAPQLSMQWSDLKTEYNKLSASEKSKLTNATYKVDGVGSSTVVTATGTTTEVVALAMSRYDILISKYSSTYSDNFIGRPASAQQNLFITQSESSTTMMIVIVSIISVSAISGFIFLKKRKEN